MTLARGGQCKEWWLCGPGSYTFKSVSPTTQASASHPGIVAKHRHSRYNTGEGNPSWVKIRNRRYSQMIGRDELFERKYEAEGAPEINHLFLEIWTVEG